MKNKDTTKFRCKKIKYDTEGQKVKLPTTMTIEMGNDELELLDEEELVDELGDAITTETDFCVLSFEYEIV